MIQPTYYVKHPDGTYSEASPQPVNNSQTKLSPLKAWRLKRYNRKLAGLRARLEATRELANATSTIPGVIVKELQSLPQQIAEIEACIKELTS